MEKIYFPKILAFFPAAPGSGGFWRHYPIRPAEAHKPIRHQTEPGTITYRELSELRRPTGEKSTGELTADAKDRPFLLVARGVEPGPTPPSGPLRVPGPGVRGEETAGNMTERRSDTGRADSARGAEARLARGA